MFRFSIRELMLVTLVVAMGTGWFCHWSAMARSNQEQTWLAEASLMTLESMDGMLTFLGFKITKEGDRKYYMPPPSLIPHDDSPMPTFTEGALKLPLESDYQAPASLEE